MGNSCLIDLVYDFNADNFDHSDLDFIGGALIDGIGKENARSRRSVAATSIKRFGMVVFGLHLNNLLLDLAGEQGFEPQLPDPESGVLPLNYSPLMARLALAINLCVLGAEGEI
jgi:hypothetical protein